MVSDHADATYTAKMDEQKTAFEAEKEAIETEKNAASEKLTAAEAQVEELTTYKNNVEYAAAKAEKDALIAKWRTNLNGVEAFEALVAKADEYELADLEKEIKVIFADARANFTAKEAPKTRIPYNTIDSKTAEEYGGLYEKYGIKPDIIIGCAGGGSNLGGLIAPFMGEKLRGENDYRIIAVEPASCPSLTRGEFRYDFCDTGMVCPLAKMYTLGSGFIPGPNHAGGLRYHGMSSILSQLYHDGLMEARSVKQTDVFAAAEQFARTEGILPAPESSHAIRAAIDEALKCKETGEEKTIVFGLTGTGYFDMVAYEKFNDGEMTDYIPTDEDLKKGFKGIPKFPGNE